MDIERLRAELREERERLLRAIAGVNEQQFKRRPGARPEDPGPWSIAEVLAHLLASERLRCERIAIALRRDGAEISPSRPEEHEEAARAGRAAPVPQLIHGLLASRRELDRLLDQTESVAGGLERAVLHPVLGRQTIGWMVREKVLDHEREHIAQIEALKRAVATPEVAR